MRTIYILDDNPEFRDAMDFWLGGAGYAVRAWSDPHEALEALSRRDRHEEACLLLDVRMPAMSGLDVHDALLESGAALPVIYMSGHADVPLAVQAMRKGAVTLLEKPFDDDTLEAALHSAFAWPQAGAEDEPGAPRRPMPTAPTAPVALEGEDAQAHARFVARERSLTPREREVLGHVIQGIYNKNIADRIGLSVKTVELYRARGMAKMQARSVAQLTRMMVSQRA
ncbi:response regulator transcription factor [Azohydromonas caseinilytica]|uniref:Response regulator transcription factor n=1 Tax=Azohydromonas caseinilytica TaxID=2728836 RepID=A0A848FL43_9BURK|nr:response regulator [Azohydromonas caseinilytica]NML18521.1 response regulator transcription factor [Azohydromonas caseinilytica]